MPYLDVNEIRRQVYLARKELVLKHKWDISISTGHLKFVHGYNFPMRGDVEIHVTREEERWRIDFFVNGVKEGPSDYVDTSLDDYIEVLRLAQKYILY